MTSPPSPPSPNQPAGVGRARAIRGVAVYLDQATSTLTNFAMTFLVLQSAASAEFGAFIIVYGAYQIAVGVNRAITAEPLMVEAGNRSALAAATGAATGLAVVGGVGLGLIGVLSSTLIDDDTARTLVLIGSVFLPGLLLLDTWRYGFFADGRPYLSLFVDALWGTILVMGVLGLRAAGTQSPASVFLTWAVAGSLAGVVAVIIGRIAPSLRHVFAWVKETVHLSGRYVLEELAKTGSNWIAFLLVAQFVDLAALGLLSGARVLFGPLNLLYLATHAYAVTEGTRLLRESDGARFRRTMYPITAALAVMPFIWAFLVQLAPASLGQAIIPTWGELTPLLYLVAIRVSAIGAIVGLRVVLRVYRAPEASLRAEVAGSVALPISTAVGVVPGTVAAAAIGIGLGQWLGVPFWVKGVRTVTTTSTGTGGGQRSVGHDS